MFNILCYPSTKKRGCSAEYSSSKMHKPAIVQMPPFSKDTRLAWVRNQRNMLQIIGNISAQHTVYMCQCFCVLCLQGFWVHLTACRTYENVCSTGYMCPAAATCVCTRAFCWVRHCAPLCMLMSVGVCVYMCAFWMSKPLCTTVCACMTLHLSVLSRSYRTWGLFSSWTRVTASSLSGNDCHLSLSLLPVSLISQIRGRMPLMYTVSPFD